MLNSETGKDQEKSQCLSRGDWLMECNVAIRQREAALCSRKQRPPSYVKRKVRTAEQNSDCSVHVQERERESVRVSACTCAHLYLYIFCLWKKAPLTGLSDCPWAGSLITEGLRGRDGRRSFPLRAFLYLLKFFTFLVEDLQGTR